MGIHTPSTSRPCHVYAQYAFNSLCFVKRGVYFFTRNKRWTWTFERIEAMDQDDKNAEQDPFYPGSSEEKKTNRACFEVVTEQYTWFLQCVILASTIPVLANNADRRCGIFFDLTVRCPKLTPRLGASTYVLAGLAKSFNFRVITADNRPIPFKKQIPDFTNILFSLICSVRG